MTASNEPRPEPRVSDEDRQAAIDAVALALASGVEDETKWFRGTAAEAVDGVVSHGWGPKPRVSADAIEDAAGCCGHQLVIDLLRECGIEVTDD